MSVVANGSRGSGCLQCPWCLRSLYNPEWPGRDVRARMSRSAIPQTRGTVPVPAPLPRPILPQAVTTRWVAWCHRANLEKYMASTGRGEGGEHRPLLPSFPRDRQPSDSRTPCAGHRSDGGVERTSPHLGQHDDWCHGGGPKAQLIGVGGGPPQRTLPQLTGALIKRYGRYRGGGGVGGNPFPSGIQFETTPDLATSHRIENGDQRNLCWRPGEMKAWRAWPGEWRAWPGLAWRVESVAWPGKWRAWPGLER